MNEDVHPALAMLAVGVGGALGALARHGIAEVLRRIPAWPPYVSTLVANLIGCFVIGLVFSLLQEADHRRWSHPFLVTGLLGSFTTFSTFGLDAMHLINEGRYGELVAYVLTSVAVGLVAVKMGMLVAG